LDEIEVNVDVLSFRVRYGILSKGYCTLIISMHNSHLGLRITNFLDVRLANSKARIKPTAPLSAFDKKNLIEFLLYSVHYLYMKSNPNPSFYPMLPYELLSSYTSINKKRKEKKRKRKKNNQKLK